jgi:CubicO group peptidase (beta-lactamase class C family)
MKKGRRFTAGAVTLALLGALTFTANGEDVRESLYPHENEPIATVEHIYSGQLLPDEAVNTFRNIHRLFPSRTVKSAGNPFVLPRSARPLDLTKVRIKDGKATYDIYDYLAMDRVTAMLVIKDGEIVFEAYQNGNTENTRWMSMSVAKAVTSTLAGAAIKDGHIKSLDDRVTDYVPSLAGSAYEGVTVKQLLRMISGVKWNEEYTDPASDRRALLRAQIAQQPGALMGVMKKLPRAGKPGTLHNYSTGETQVLGELVYRATGKPLADYLSEKIWTPFGMEADATWWLDSPDGVEIGGSGIGATLRDFGRFGLFFLNGGQAGGKQVLPENWMSDASTPFKLAKGKTVDYGYMWWPAATDAAIKDKAFCVGGIFGQWLYINPTQNVVIAAFGAQSKPAGSALIEPLGAFAVFDAVVAALSH